MTKSPTSISSIPLSAGPLQTDVGGPAAIDMSELRTREFHYRLSELRTSDNVTNWYYLAREYAYLAMVLGSTLTFFFLRHDWGISGEWNVPVTLVAILLVGSGQHRLVMLGHEASHFLLFKNLKLNEWAANWFCFYPVWSMVYYYRIQHLAHHQFTNDPERDPAIEYMAATGQRFYHPMPLGEFLRECVLKVLFGVPGLIRYTTARVRSGNAGAKLNGAMAAYVPRVKPPRVVPLVNLAYFTALIGTCVGASLARNLPLLFLAPLTMLAVLLVFNSLAPGYYFMETTMKPVIPMRWASFQRQVYFALHFTLLGYLTIRTGMPWITLYFLLWIVPLATVFSFLMILRDDMQHSNTAIGRLLDTRNFVGNPLFRWAVFPLNMNLHLPHHLFPMVPHYRLRDLDKLLLQTRVYRKHATYIEGFLFQQNEASIKEPIPESALGKAA